MTGGLSLERRGHLLIGRLGKKAPYRREQDRLSVVSTLCERWSENRNVVLEPALSTRREEAKVLRCFQIITELIYHREGVIPWHPQRR